jgi:hypothetical protein
MGVGTLDGSAAADAPQVEDRLAVLCGQRNALDAELVALTAEVLESGSWQVPGVTSPSHWLVWKAGVSPAHARQVVRLARRRGELPVTFAAFGAGELSADQVTPIVDRAPSHADRELCEMARVMTVPQLRRVVRAFEAPRDPDEVPRGESLSLCRGGDGRWRLRGELDADHGAIVDAALREAHDAVFHRDGAIPTGVDALVEVAQRSLDTVGDPARRDRFRVHLHVDAERADAPTTDGWGHRIPDWLRDLALCDSTISAVFESERIPVSVGRAQRAVPERTRRLVIRRDRGCRVPGCTAERVVQIHHLVHWDPDDGAGPTDTWNLIAICARHHRMHHRGELGISGNADDPDGVVFTDRHGRELAAGPRPRPPTGPPPAAAVYQHPLGERLQLRWVTFNPN